MPAVAWGIDAASKVSVDTLHSQGASFLCCYLAPYPSQGWKMRTPAEWKEYLNAGIKIVANWESDGTPKNGFNDGVEAAKTAQQYLKDRGADDAVVYFSAADKDPAALDLAKLADYHKGNVSVLGWDRVGAYGGYGAIKYLADRNVCKYYWQTYAWSKGQWDARAQLRQWKNTQTLDFDEAWSSDFGQWPRAGVVAPAPAPVVVAPTAPKAPVDSAEQINQLAIQLCQQWDNPGPPVGPGKGWPVELIANTHKRISELTDSLAAVGATYTAIQQSYNQVMAKLNEIEALVNPPKNTGSATNYQGGGL